MSLTAGEVCSYLWHAAAKNPCIRPGLHILSAGGVEGSDQVRPFGVAIGVLREINLQATLEGRWAETEFELLQNCGCLLVDNRAVGRFRILEVGNILEDRRRALGLINAVRLRLDVFEKVLPWVSLRLERVHCPICHVLRETLLQPEIIEPAHGDKIPKPLMSEFVERGNVAPEAIRTR